MITLALKNLWNRKTRSLLTLLGIAVGIQLYVIMSSVMDSFDHDLQKQVAGMAGRIVVQQKGEAGVRFPPVDSVVMEASAYTMISQPGVDAARSSPVLFQVMVPPPAPNMPPAVMAAGLLPGHERAFLGGDMVLPHPLAGTHDLILGANAAAHFGVGVGDSLTLLDESFTVVDVLPETNRLIDSTMLLPLVTAQQLFIRPSLVSAVLVTATSADGAPGLAAAIESAYPQLLAATADDVAKSANALLATQRSFFAMINGTALTIAAVVVMIVMVMAIFERKKEIGTLMAIGASARWVVGLVMTESLALSLAGGLFALPVSTLVNGLMMGVYHVDPLKWMQTLLLATCLGAVAGLWPAWAALRVTPLESLRYE